MKLDHSFSRSIIGLKYTTDEGHDNSEIILELMEWFEMMVLNYELILIIKTKFEKLYNVSECLYPSQISTKKFFTQTKVKYSEKDHIIARAVII